MRKAITVIAIAVLLGTSLPAVAELQNIEVGGSIRIRGNYIHNTFNENMMPEQRPRDLLFPGLFSAGRPIGNPNGVGGIFDWNNKGADMAFVEQRTRLHVKADFTENVSAFIEIDSYDIWGEDFRSPDYITGTDARASINGTDAEVELFQAYIEADEMFGVPLRLRIGRQEIALGSQFLVGTRDFAFLFYGLSFDAVRLTYTHDAFSIDVFAALLDEKRSGLFEDGMEFYGVYGSCTAVEDMTFDLYWLLLRDSRPLEDTNGSWLLERWEDRIGVDHYETTTLHTVGFRAAGEKWGFDADGEVAYQFGEADAVGARFRPVGLTYGDDNAWFNNFGIKLDAGYTIDVQTQPRLFVGFRYYGGEDNRDINFQDWLAQQFPLIYGQYKPNASVNFNRLFSNQIASGFVDAMNDLSNAWQVGGGIQFAPVEQLHVLAGVNYYEMIEKFESRPTRQLPGQPNVVFPRYPLQPWRTDTNSGEIGIETQLGLEYQYTEDLVFEAGWCHLFAMAGLEEGGYAAGMGTGFNGGSSGSDADYVYVGTKIFF